MKDAIATIEVPANEIDVEVYEICRERGKSFAEAIAYAKDAAEDESGILAELHLINTRYCRIAR